MKLKHNSKLNIVTHSLKDCVQTMKKEREKMNNASTVLEKKPLGLENKIGNVIRMHAHQSLK